MKIVQLRPTRLTGLRGRCQSRTGCNESRITEDITCFSVLPASYTLEIICKVPVKPDLWDLK